ncbi:MAG: Asp-tRNA(Asn)/Glu-tRNA(Gln) amidotransferase subunit GatA, partial [Candidatus Brocadiae bacterium]|nr:Asp-tRNA(Asn)/Glu-tRNA(Gln) amidotransferase subunit GatA [Candidatus Brocadiia bacterium]
MEIYNLTASQLSKLLSQKEISSEEIVRSLYSYIEKRDPELKAFLSLCQNNALEQAKASDSKRTKGNDPGILEGLPVVIKDNICTQGIRTTCASQILANFIPPYNAHAIEKIQEQGGIVLGKTNMDEFAMGSSCENSAMFPTLNPRNTQCIPGGSSGGSACAVASGMSPLALGSDTGGSVRQPAALCGIVGMKPTYGRVSRYGLIAFASSLDQIGPLTRTVEDNALLLQAIAGKDHRDSTSLNEPVPQYSKKLKEFPVGIKIGIPKEYFISEMDQEIQAACQKAIVSLEKKGAKIQEVSLPGTEYAIPTYYLVATAEASANLARYDGIHYGHRSSEKNALKEQGKALDSLYKKSRGEGFGHEVKRRILLGTYILSSGYYEAWYLKAMKARALIRQEIQDTLKGVDALITPTSPVTAFKQGEKVSDPLSMYLCDIFTVTFSLSGNPALSIPCGLTKQGMPVGLQIVGKFLDEETVLRLGYACEQTLPIS